MMIVELFFDSHRLMAVTALGFARIAPTFFILAFLNSNVLTAAVRLPVIMMIVLGVWPYDRVEMLGIGMADFVLAIAFESAIGLLLGCLLGWPFWVFHALGGLIDNQRGATLSSSIDPANGVDTSELANFLNIFACVVYLQGGGMLMMLELFASSYQVCSPLQGCELALPQIVTMLNELAAKMLVLASPVVIALLLSEALLGLLSRFAPQMNAFSLSLTIKSWLALLILLFYFRPVLPESVRQLTFAAPELIEWLGATGKAHGE